MKSVSDDLAARSAFRLAVKALVDAEILRRQTDFRNAVGEDAFSMAAIEQTVRIEASNV